jgi:predicted nucleotidyltransferase
MGRAKTRTGGIASALFSQVQLRVLAILLGHADRQFHASEIIRLAQSGTGAVQRELEKLTDAGILTVTSSGNRKVYQANRQSPIFDELHDIILKTVGLVEPIRNALRSFKSKIRFAFVYGSVAKGRDTAKSDIDLLVVGDELAYSDIFGALQKAEQTLRRPISPNLMTLGEWDRKRSDGTAFVRKILEQPKLFVFGNEDELSGTG